MTDGQHYYAAFDTKEDGLVIGVLPVNADPKLVLVQPFDKPIEVEAVDDTMLLYSTESFQQGSEEYWEVPTAGGASVFGAAVSLGDVKPLLHDHTIYFVDSSNAPTNTIWALSETPNSTAKKVVTTSTPIFAIATDSCGIVYTTTDDTVQNGIVTRVAF